MRSFVVSPDAVAYVRGGEKAPNLSGTVAFFQKCEGVLVRADVCGLPERDGFFALHIHEGRGCGGEGFSETGGHYNPAGEAHPCHAGDLPPLLSCHGWAHLEALTNRFCVKDILGCTVVIHSGADDFHSQPAGNAGEKIACGRICAR